MIKAVLFDLDGTIIDTEKYYRKCWPLAAAHFGYKMTDEGALSLRSLGRPFAPIKLAELLGDENIDYYAIRDYRKEIMEKMIEEEGIAVKPGAVELLTFLRENGIQAAVVTASDIERTERYLGMVGLTEYFDSFISATMVKEGKPSPDVYAYACRELGLNPDTCLAVEDSPNGISSAKSAGCKVVMVPDQAEPDEETMEKLDAKVSSLDKIIEIIEKIKR
nr:HAD family phosphatase [Eubacterium sp.]